MRFLLIDNHCISDPTSGDAQCLLTLARWLVEAGHECRSLTTARIDSLAFTIDEHLQSLGVAVPRTRRQDSAQRKRGGKKSKQKASAKRKLQTPVVRYEIGGVPITLLLTRHNDERKPNRDEGQQYLKRLKSLLDEYQPDQLIAAGGHPMLRSGMELAKQRGITTVFSVRAHGYDDPKFFEHVDHVVTCSTLLSDRQLKHIGTPSTPLPPPIDWSQVVAPKESRAFVTFVNPSPHKGVALFARLADMLGSRRPDIPLLVVQSGQSAGSLNSIPGIDFTKYPQIMAAPPVARPAEYFALTRVLLVPSVCEEVFVRVAAEALINRIPPLVSDRGFLPDVVGGDFAAGGGGRVLPVPAWLDQYTPKLPSEEETQPWYDAVCQLWDDEKLYDAIATRAGEIADERYGELASRRRCVSYLAELRPREGGVGQVT